MSVLSCCLTVIMLSAWVDTPELPALDICCCLPATLAKGMRQLLWWFQYWCCGWYYDEGCWIIGCKDWWLSCCFARGFIWKGALGVPPGDFYPCHFWYLGNKFLKPSSVVAFILYLVFKGLHLFFVFDTKLVKFSINASVHSFRMRKFTILTQDYWHYDFHRVPQILFQGYFEVLWCTLIVPLLVDIHGAWEKKAMFNF